MTVLHGKNDLSCHVLLLFLSLCLSLQSNWKLWVAEEIAAQISFVLGEFPSYFKNGFLSSIVCPQLHYYLQMARKVCQCICVLVHTWDTSRHKKLLDLLSIYISSIQKVLDVLSFADILLYFPSMQRFKSALEGNVRLRLKLFLARAVWTTCFCRDSALNSESKTPKSRAGSWESPRDGMSIFNIPTCLGGACVQCCEQLIPSDPGCSSRAFLGLKTIVLLQSSEFCVGSRDGKRRKKPQTFALKMLGNK